MDAVPTEPSLQDASSAAGRFVAMLAPPPDAAPGPGLWFCVRDGDVLVRTADDGSDEVPQADGPGELGLPADATQFLGTLDGRPCWSADAAAADAAAPNAAFVPLRALYGRVPERHWTLAGRAVQLVEWDRTHRYCGRCATPTETAPGERARRCPACGLLAYPRLAPAVIVLVERGDEVLLARGRNFPLPMYSALAGFVEPGESLEEAVHREVGEEVGVELADVAYAGSQPWPFPHSLMIGFTARWAGGEIRIDETELADARWCAPDDLPNLPSKLSIARRLIDDWLARRGRP